MRAVRWKGKLTNEKTSVKSHKVEKGTEEQVASPLPKN